MPWACRFVDRLSHRFLVPRYAAKAGVDHRGLGDHARARHAVSPRAARAGHDGLLRASTTSFAGRSRAARLEAIRRKYSLPPRFVLYAGAIYPPKNFTRLVRAYAKVGPERGVPLVVAGGENRFLSERELLEPEALGIAEWVRRPGWIEQEELAGVYALADALLLPSLFESCGLPVLEAMAAGCPVVTADRYGTKELAEGAAVLVDPENVDEHRRRHPPGAGRHAARRCPAGRRRSRSPKRRASGWSRCARQTLPGRWTGRAVTGTGAAEPPSRSS